MRVLSREIVVAGGGVAGTCAALAAARGGASTLLLEARPGLGGTGTSGMLRHICGLYGTGDTAPTETLNGGLAAEIAERLLAMAPGRTVRGIGQVYVLPYGDGDLRAVLIDLCGAESNLTVVTSTPVVRATMAGERMTGVTVAGRDGLTDVSAGCFIDCTGEAALAALAGVGCDLSPLSERQLAGFTIRVAGLRDVDDMASLRVPYFCAQGAGEGVLPPLLRFTTFSPGDSPDEGFCKLSLDGDDGEEREQRARHWAMLLIGYLGRVLPSFGGARIVGMAERVLDREGRRARGEYILTEDDVLSGRKFTDGIVKNSWPIEVWDRSRGTGYRFLPKGEHYEIPLRCLRVKRVANLLTAGRCISATPAALASTRVMGTCMALGEQAALAALRLLRG